MTIKVKIVEADILTLNPFYRKTYLVITRNPEGEWNRKGRQYDEKGIATYVHQGRVSKSGCERREFVFEPKSLEKEIDSIIMERIFNKSDAAD